MFCVSYALSSSSFSWFSSLPELIFSDDDQQMWLIIGYMFKIYCSSVLLYFSHLRESCKNYPIPYNWFLRCVHRYRFLGQWLSTSLDTEGSFFLHHLTKMNINRQTRLLSGQLPFQNTKKIHLALVLHSNAFDWRQILYWRNTQ